jgi:Haem-binding uptake, Tiki superfamily, ChaN
MRTMTRHAFREQMIALQREVFVRNHARINQGVVGYTAAYRRYEKEYQKGVLKYQQESTFDELLDAVSRSDIVYVGDYHTLAQAQRTVVRILRRLPTDVKPTLAVEMVQGRFQRVLNAYLQDTIDETTFLKRIKHDDGGVFGAWQHFKPIFDYARDNALSMVGIDLLRGHSRTSLKQRDTYAAKIIAKAYAERDAGPVIVQVGELHVAKAHLPAAVDREIKRLKREPAKTLIVHQNAEEIYWQLESKGLEHETEVVKVRAGELCVITTPPIVCQQSYLNWLDRDDDVLDDEAPEKSFKTFVEILARVLGIPVGRKLDEVVVSSVVDVHFLETVRERGNFNRTELKEIKRQILRSESYFIPKANMVYLGQLSINHAAEEASHFLRHLSGGDIEPRYLVDAFYYRVLNEAIGFLGSKLINHKRKCPHRREFEAMLKRKGGDSFTRRVARLVVKHKELEDGQKPSGLRELYSSDADTFNAVTHALGYILGDKLYYAMIQGTMSKSDVRELYFDHFEEDGQSLTTYLALCARLSRVKLPKRSM